MAIDEHLPPACAFAISVLVERDMDPDAVPEEAVEAAQHHLATCIRCLSTPPTLSPPRKKKKIRRVPEQDDVRATSTEVYEETAPPPGQGVMGASNRDPVTGATKQAPAQQRNLPAVAVDKPVDCVQCRQMLKEYAEAMDNGENVAALYPEMYEHLLGCETGCLLLLELFRQEAKANRKFRRRPVQNPFSAIAWELSGFFRGGQIPMSAMALSYGTLILLLIVASLTAFLAVRWDDARYYHPVHRIILPTPDGVGLSDGLKVYDACNAGSYQYKREAAQAMQNKDFSRATSLLSSATSAGSADTTGCNGAEAAIYHEDLQVRQSGRPFGVLVVSFDSGPGNADPSGGTDRHILYAAYTQELVGAVIAQQQYNYAQMQIPGAPLLYLVLANTTGTEQGALQIANSLAAMASTADLQQFGLLAQGQAPLLGVLGLAPSSLAEVTLPVLCRAGVPMIVPTATGVFIIDLLRQTSLYRHCAPGFAFIRFSPDDAAQSLVAANYAYDRLQARNAAVFYDPSNPSAVGSAEGFIYNFSRRAGAHIAARETVVASGLLDANGRPQAAPEDLLAALKDALQARPRPDLLFAPLLTNDVITLAQDIARLPVNQQPALMIGGEFVHPTALQGLAQWARQQQLALPRLFVSLSSAVRPPGDDAWQKAFYASFCTSFAPPGSHCSGAGALDQGGLLFADGVEIVTKALGSMISPSQFPKAAQLVQRISKEKFAGVSCPITLHLWANVLVTSTQVLPVILGVQGDGSLQIVG